MSQQEHLTNNSSARPSIESPSRKRPISERRIQANRSNALRSTGPRTERGKRTVARNAIKHGVLAREVVIMTGEGREDVNEFHDIVERFCEQYEPIGIVEESLVQTIATCLWRKARVIRAENGEIRNRLDLLSVDTAHRISDESNLNVAIEGFDLRPFNAEKSADGKVSSREPSDTLHANLWEHQSGFYYLKLLLNIAKSDIAREGWISESIREKIRSAFHSWDSIFAMVCYYGGSSQWKVQPNPSTDTGAEEAERRTCLLASIDDQLRRIEDFRRLAELRAKLAQGAELRKFSLPPADAADKLLRYEAHLDRQLYRAMDQLERLQRLRRGEVVPPPHQLGRAEIAIITKQSH